MRGRGMEGAWKRVASQARSQAPLSRHMFRRRRQRLMNHLLQGAMANSAMAGQGGQLVELADAAVMRAERGHGAGGTAAAQEAHACAVVLDEHRDLTCCRTWRRSGRRSPVMSLLLAHKVGDDALPHPPAIGPCPGLCGVSSTDVARVARQCSRRTRIGAAAPLRTVYWGANPARTQIKSAHMGMNRPGGTPRELGPRDLRLGVASGALLLRSRPMAGSAVGRTAVQDAKEGPRTQIGFATGNEVGRTSR